jgi:hypothetical protein
MDGQRQRGTHPRVRHALTSRWELDVVRADRQWLTAPTEGEHDQRHGFLQVLDPIVDHIVQEIKRP